MDTPKVGSRKALMIDPKDIVDLDRYPVDRLGTQAGDAEADALHRRLERDGIVELPDFVTGDALEALRA